LPSVTLGKAFAECPKKHSAKNLVLGKESFADKVFAECYTRQSLCRVSEKNTRQRIWYSAKNPLPIKYLSSVTLGKAFVECKIVFPECIRYSAKNAIPVVRLKIMIPSSLLSPYVDPCTYRHVTTMIGKSILTNLKIFLFDEKKKNELYNCTY
jgi:hypothetical protein